MVLIFDKKKFDEINLKENSLEKTKDSTINKTDLSCRPEKKNIFIPDYKEIELVKTKRNIAKYYRYNQKYFMNK